MKRKLFWLSLILALPLAASAASASSIVDITYTGLVGRVTQQGGPFGDVTPGVTAYTANYVYDLSRMGWLSFIDSSDSYIRGGTQTGDLSPAIEASFTVNGITETLNTDFGGSVAGGSQFFIGAIFQEHDIYEPNGYLMNGIINRDGTLSSSITDPFSYNVKSADYASGRFNDGSAIFALNPQTLTETLGVSPVPLPPSLPMFGAALLVIAGLGYARQRGAAPRDAALTIGG